MPDLLAEIRSRVAQLKRQFPDADDDAIEDFVCRSIDFELRLKNPDPLPKQEPVNRRRGLFAAVWRWFRRTIYGKILTPHRA